MESICVFGNEYNKGTDREIMATKNGRYINLVKKSDKDKEFRYDISTGQFERINHYKKGDKITPVKTKNITRWFTDCSIFCDDKKFAKLMITNKYHSRNHLYKSGVRFIEALSSDFARNYEAWLSLGIEITDVKKRIDECIRDERSYWRPMLHTDLYVHPKDIDKRILKHIQQNYKEVSSEQIKTFYRMRNLDTLMKMIEISHTDEYDEIFLYKWSKYRYGEGYTHYEENIFNLDADLDYSASRIRDNIISAIDSYNLDIQSFCNFLLRAHNVEGLTLNDLFGSSHYNDYLNMEKILKHGKMSKINKYPRQFLTQFHILKREYNAHKKEYDNIRFKEQCDSFKYLEKKYKKYQIVVPHKIEQIENEADELHHCVRTYIDRVVEGRTLIVFLRANEDKDQPLVTIEVKNGRVTQAYGKFDKKPEDEELDTIRQWAKDKRLKLAWVWTNN